MTRFWHPSRRLCRGYKTTDPNSNTTQTVLNANDQAVGFIDGLGKLSNTVFNSLGLVQYQVDALGGLTRYVHDANGNLVSLTDAVGNTTKWVHDKNGNVIEEIDPLGKSRTWTHDDANNVATYTDRLGRHKTFEYFDNGLLKKEIWKTSPTGTTVNTIEYTYNNNDQMLTATDNAGTYTLTYTTHGELDTWAGPYGGTLDYRYDGAGRQDLLTYPGSATMTLTWADDNRLSSRSFDAGTPELRLEYSYNDRDEVTEVRRYSDAAGSSLVGKTVYTRDDAGRTTGMHHKDGSNATINNLQYVYNNANNVTQETSTNGPTRNYTYSAKHELLGDGTNSYTFDLNGNRTMSGYTTTAGNRIASDGTWNYTWDDEGNLSTRTKISTGEIWLYTWDHDNRLTNVERKPSSSGAVNLRIEYQFDVFANRIKRTIDADGDGSGSSTSTKYSFDPIGNTWADLDNSGSLTSRRFFEDALDAVFARMDASSGNEEWLTTDRLGSVRDILNASGTLIDAIVFDSFGKVVSETSPSNGDRMKAFGFEVDPDSGHGINGERWYSFDFGGWLSHDPIGFAGGAAKLNEYVGNNPANATDPSGLALIAYDREAALDLQRWLANDPGRYFRDASPGIQTDIIETCDRFVIVPRSHSDYQRLQELRHDPQWSTNSYLWALRNSGDLECYWSAEAQCDGYLQFRDSYGQYWTWYSRSTDASPAEAGAAANRRQVFEVLEDLNRPSGRRPYTGPPASEAGLQPTFELHLLAAGGFTLVGRLAGWFSPPPAPAIVRPETPSLPAFDGRSTHGVLITNEGPVIPLQSGNPSPVYSNYPAASHVEGKAAIWIRENFSTGGVVYHNNPSGTCGFCHAQVPTLLPEGARLTVVPPAGTVTPPRWFVNPNPYVGNSAIPRPHPRLGGG